MKITKYGIISGFRTYSVPNSVYEMREKMNDRELCEVNLLLNKAELTKLLELKKTLDNSTEQ